MSSRKQARSVMLVVTLGTALAGAAPCPVRADEAAAIGRIFLTPAQRRLLDQRRQTPGAHMNSDMPADLLPAHTATSRRVVLNGVIRRGQQTPLVWINGERADRATAAGNGLRVRRGPDRDNGVTVELQRAGESARLKPGQAWDPVSGTVTDCVQCGQLPPAETPTEPALPSEPASEPKAQLTGPVAAADAMAVSTAAPGAGPLKTPGSP